jgi:CheY-like chemotaxis protein
MQSSSTLMMNARSGDYPRARHAEALFPGAGHRLWAPPAIALAPEELRILIVNEDMQSANTLKHVLWDLGYCTTLTAYSGSRGLVAADDFSPALAFVDLDLPDMSGFQLAWKIRAHARRHVRQIPLVAVAEPGALASHEFTRAAGFVGRLTKPVEAEDLRQLLRRLPR